MGAKFKSDTEDEEIVTILTLAAMFPAVFFISLLFSGIDRKLHARMQKRIGPPVIQPLYDFVKLMNKERIIPITASPGVFTSVTIFAAVCAILGAAVPMVNILTRISFIGDLILVFYLLAMSSILIMIGGSSSGNPFGAIGFSRKMTILIGYEVPLIISTVILSLKSGFSLAYYDIIQAQTRMGSCFAFASLSTAVAMISFMSCIPAGAGVVPFDISEAKTEVAHGPLIEYGGPYLALLKLAKDATSFALTFLGLTLFLFFPALFENTVLMDDWFILALCLGGTLIIMFFTVTLPRTIFARLKLGQAVKFLLVPWLLSILSLVLYLFGM